MVDALTPQQRSRNMASIKGADTKPEKLVRSMLHGLGYRFRLHRKDLPGKPDLVFPSRRKVIFVHGCFWHRHDCRKGKSTPSTNTEFWKAKRASTVDRDIRALNALSSGGWKVFVAWECSLRDPDSLRSQLQAFLGADAGSLQQGSISGELAVTTADRPSGCKRTQRDNNR
jgi:DNA mismatch endonuclease (patch repair protein)